MTPAGLDVLSTLDAVSAETGMSLAQISLAWVAAQPGITAPVASATSVDQLEDLLGAMHATLLPEHLALLDAASTAMGTGSRRECRLRGFFSASRTHAGADLRLHSSLPGNRSANTSLCVNSSKSRSFIPGSRAAIATRSE